MSDTCAKCRAATDNPRYLWKDGRGWYRPPANGYTYNLNEAAKCCLSCAKRLSRGCDEVKIQSPVVAMGAFETLSPDMANLVRERDELKAEVERLKAERYLPIDCPNCGRRRLCYWPEKNECECDKCGYSTETDARAAKEDGDTQPRRTDGGHGGNFAEPWEDTPMNESNDIIDKAYTRIMQGHVRKDRMAANETQRSLEEFAKDIRKAERKKTLEDIEALAREKSRELKSSLRRDDAVAFLVYRDFADELCRMGEEKDKTSPESARFVESRLGSTPRGWFVPCA